jgi:L-threonylcarbamoyladenylate synthase
VLTLESAIEEAVAALAADGLVVYPTETVYGIGVDAGSGDALERLVNLKGRDAGKGISVLVSELGSTGGLLAGPPPAAALKAARAFWPGPLTIVLPAAAGVSPLLVGPTGGIGLRCSSDPVCSALLRAFGRPLTSTSANPSGEAPATSVEEARNYFGSAVDCYLDGGLRRGRAVSTVVEFRDGSAYLRRAGAVSVHALGSIIVLDSDAS